MSRSTAESVTIERSWSQPGERETLSHQRPTMLDVAALAGVGLTTVSRVVNGKPGVSQATIGRVRAAIEQLDTADVRVEPSPRIGRPRRSDSFSRTSPTRSCRPSTARSRTLPARAGCSSSWELRRGCRSRARFISALRARRVTASSSFRRGPTTATCSRSAGRDRDRLRRPPPRFLDADSVTSDDHGYLHGCPSRRDGPRANRVPRRRSRDRTRARRLRYTDGLAGQGLDFESAIVRTGLRSIEDAGAASLRSSPTARRRRRCSRPRTTSQSGVQGSPRTRSLGAVAVVGFDDFPLAEMLDPPVTVVAHDPVELGLTAARSSFAGLDGDRSTSEHIVCPVQLVPRGSGEIEPAAAR